MIKPKLGQKFYFVDREELCINKEEVLAIGDGFVIPSGFSCYREHYQMMNFEDCYTSLAIAKVELKKEYLSKNVDELILKETIKGQQWEYIYKGDKWLYD